MAVSGGADSMSLALLLSRWGRPHAFIVDHGLRPESASEAALVAGRLAALAIPARILSASLRQGSAAAERARHARYDLLLASCRDAGLIDLFLGHHEADQAETVAMRGAAGSGPAGLAGMAPLAYREAARLCRPLLAIPPERLRATLLEAQVAWLEDPSNTDPRFQRARLRAAFDPAVRARALAAAGAHAGTRTRLERAVASELARVRFHPEGHAVIDGPIGPATLSAIVWAVSGRPYPPPAALLRAGLATRSLHGVLLRPAGRSGPGVLVTREPDAVASPVPSGPFVRWDGRFEAAAGMPTGFTLGALGAEARRFAGHRLPSVVRRTLPAVRLGGELIAVPHLAFPDPATCRSFGLWRSSARPASGAPFLNPLSPKGV